MVIKVAGYEYCVTNKPKRHNKSHSLSSITHFGIEIETTKIEKNFYCNNNCASVECKNRVASKDSAIVCDKNEDSVKDNMETSDISTKANKSKREERKLPTTRNSSTRSSITSKKSNVSRQRDSVCTNPANNDGYKVSKSKSEGNPFRHKKEGKIIKVNRPNIRGKT